jgi:hypothetical protein
MIVIDILAKESPQVLLVEDNQVIETLAANTADDPFDVRALPRRVRRRQDLLDAEAFDAPAEVPAVDLVAIPYQLTRRGVPGKGIDHLLRCPLG